MMSRKSSTLLLSLVTGIALTPADSGAAQSLPDDYRAAVIVAAARAAGLSGDETLDYFSELEAARRASERQFYCSPVSSVEPFPDDLREKMIVRTLDALKQAGFAARINERPAYTTDLIVTAITSLEYGRLLNFTPDQRAEVCATPGE